jgi:DNA-binding CsgD family transcriptional regulator
MARLHKDTPGWLFTPEAKSELSAENERDFFDNPGLFKTIIESIQDGVSILGPELNIRYMNTTMRYIYTDEKDAIGKKCYEVYHSLSSPCENCPSLLALRTGKSQTGTIRYERNGRESHWHQIFAIPVRTSRNEVILIMEYVRDVTFQNNMLENLSELAQRFETLEYQNRLLADILRRRKQSSAELEETISTNVEKYIKPSLEYLKKTVDAENVDLVNGLIDEIVYPITKKRSSAISALTPRELQVAALVKEGFSSKEIADKFCVTQKAVDYHRLNIRKKLRLSRSDNLRSYLEIHL